MKYSAKETLDFILDQIGNKPLTNKINREINNFRMRLQRVQAQNIKDKTIHNDIIHYYKRIVLEEINCIVFVALFDDKIPYIGNNEEIGTFAKNVAISIARNNLKGSRKHD